MPVPSNTVRARWLLRLALATGFPSVSWLVIQSALAVAAVTLVQRFLLYPPAPLGFDVGMALAALAIVLLLGFFMTRDRTRAPR